MPPDSPAGVKKFGLDGEEPEEDVSDSRLMTPQFDLEPYARAHAEDIEDSEVRSLSSDEDVAVARRMWAAFAQRQFAKALAEAEALLANHPRHAVANACAKECRIELEAELAARLHAPDGVPRVVGCPDSRSGLDHRDGFVLSQIDGVSSVATLIDICAMERLELLAVLEKLVKAGLVVVDQ